MTDNVTVYNSPLTNYDVRTTKTVTDKDLQHVRLDVGTGSAESQVGATVGLPTVSVATAFTFQTAMTLSYDEILSTLSEVGTIQANAVVLWFYNNTNVELMVSFDITHPHSYVPAHGTFCIDGRTNNRFIPASTPVHVQYAVIAPTEGNVSLSYLS
jgi:hypothetical protein